MGRPLAPLLIACLAAACDGTIDHRDPPGGDSAASGAVGGSATASGAEGGRGSTSSSGEGGACFAPCEASALCPESPCGDCLDNDRDGLVDMQSPQCVTPCSYSESLFDDPPTGIDPCKRDCAFDYDQGSGNDGCEFDMACDPEGPGGVDCPADATAPCLPLQQKCLDVCLPLTPNGCDCAGCCELPPRSGEFRSILAHAASRCSVLDLAGCRECTPRTECFNPCDTCELCLGETQLAPECAQPVCPEGVQSCGAPCQASCPPDGYCRLGCCVPSG